MLYQDYYISYNFYGSLNDTVSKYIIYYYIVTYSILENILWLELILLICIYGKVSH